MAAEWTEGDEDIENDNKDRLLPDIFPDDTNQVKQESKLLTYLQCYFVTIAAILGTGILGLPVKLSNCGFMPFLIVFVLGFFVQVLVIYYFVEILQRAVVIKQDQDRRDSMLSSNERVPLHGNTEDNETDSTDDQDKEVEINREENGTVTKYHVAEDFIPMKHYPSLHSLAELFLGPGLQQIFDLAILIMLVSLLISYALAGSQAYAELGNFELLQVIPYFTWTCAVIIIFFQSFVQPFVSVLTFCKGSLFSACVLAAMYVGYYVGGEITEDFKAAGEPFLLGTVAIGGVINIMPMIFTKIQLQASQIVRFRQAIIAGTVTCVILNILWCYAVLEIVPQKECHVHSSIIRSFIPSNSTATSQPTPQQRLCSNNDSLQWADANGQISTIPLTEILQQKYTDFAWIALLIEIFVMISITVSFLTMGAALRHMLDGWFDSFFTLPTKPEKNRCNFNRRCVCKTVGLFVVFGFVFVVAMFNPKSFIIILERAVSLILNLESGIFLSIMLHRAHARKYRHLGVPVPLSRVLYYLQYPVVVYFLIAVCYDIVEMIIGHSVHKLPLHKPPPYHNVHNLSRLLNHSFNEIPAYGRRWRIDNIFKNTTSKQ